ncbi:MAG: hypothetical protein R2941_07470 [Desulfobacterales bacterium]
MAGQFADGPSLGLRLPGYGCNIIVFKNPFDFQFFGILARTKLRAAVVDSPIMNAVDRSDQASFSFFMAVASNLKRISACLGPGQTCHHTRHRGSDFGFA